MPERELRRTQVLAGGYRIREAPGRPRVTIAATGVAIVEALAAAEQLAGHGVEADVVCITSADLLFRAAQARRGLADGPTAVLDDLLPAARRAPLVSVIDGHPHTLAFLGAVTGTPSACLGVQDFGQSGDVGDLHAHFGIDADTIVGAALDLL